MSAINARFMALSPAGTLSGIRDHQGWRRTWHEIVPLQLEEPVLFTPDSLLLYDRLRGEGKVFSSDGLGAIKLLKHHTGWRKSWDIIVHGQFGSDRLSDVLFYDRQAGEGKFYAVTASGDIKLLKHHTGWRKSWDVIVSFGTPSGMSQLLFYDRVAGEAKFYAVKPDGELTLLKHHTNWQRTWDVIVAGTFGGTSHMDLLFYRRVAGDAKFFSTDGQGGIQLLKHHQGWRRTWDVIVPGQFGGNGYTDLLCYDRAAGVASVLATDGSANVSTIANHSGWRRTWSKIIPGAFSEKAGTDLLFYDNSLRLRLRGVRCTDDDGGRAALTTPTQFQQWIDRANAVYGAAGIVLEFDPTVDWKELASTEINNLDKDNPDQAELDRNKAAAADYAAAYPGNVVVFFSHGYRGDGSPGGGGFSSMNANYVSMCGFDVTRTTAFYQDGSSKSIQNIKLFAHELGHYLGVPHVFVGVTFRTADGQNWLFDTPEEAVIAYLQKKGSTAMAALDGDRDYVHDTAPDVGKDFFIQKGVNPADLSEEITIPPPSGVKFTFNPDRHDVMSYFNCDDYYRITPDQVRRIRAWFMEDHRKDLVAGQL